MNLQLKNRSVLITGGSKGIGLATAKLFAQEGASIKLAARNLDDLQKAKQEIETISTLPVEIYSVDLSNSDAVCELVSQCKDIDILVNNAGAIAAGSLEGIDEELWRDGWDLKVFGYINMMREVFANMKTKGEGVIVNVCGTAGNQPAADHLPATTANSALITLTRSVGGTSLDHGIRVVGINPGDMENERGTMFLKRYAQKHLGDAGRWHEMISDLPGGKAGKSEDMANAIVFLSSPLAGYINGVVLSIDGGLSARQAVI